MQSPELRIDRSLRRSLRLFTSDRFRWLDEACAMGPLVALRLGPVRTWVIGDPALARQMLIGDAASWERPPAAIVPIRLGVGENLFTQEQPGWEVVAPIAAPAFRRRALEPRLAAMPGIIDAFVESLPAGAAFDAELEMGALALQLAAWVLLGEELSAERARDLAGHQRAVVTWVSERITRLRSIVPVAVGRPARAMRVHRGALEAYADEVIARAERRLGGAGAGVGGSAGVGGDAEAPDGGGDVLGLLVGAAGAHPRHLSRAALRSHVLGLLLAGNETTAAALCWVLVNAARHPQQWAAVRAGAAAGDVSAAQAFTAETLRLTPAVWGFARRPAVRGATLAGQRIGRAEVVTVHLRGINRDPALWDDPLAFRADRHHTPTHAQEQSLLPFGLGPRGCVGQHLALAELHAVVPALARRGDAVITHDVVEDPSFALRVRGGLRAALVPA